MANRIIRGPTVELDDDVFECPQVLEEIKDAMENDSDDPEETNAKLIELYYKSNADDRETINATLALVCGYGLPTLLRIAEAQDDLMEFLEIPLDVPDRDEELEDEA